MKKSLWIAIIVSIHLMMLLPSAITAQYIDGYSVDWQPSRTLIAQVSAGRLSIFDTQLQGEIRLPAALEQNNINFVVWNHNGTQLAIDSGLVVSTHNSNGGTYVWDMQTYQQVAYYSHSGFVHHFSLSPYGAQLALNTSDEPNRLHTDITFPNNGVQIVVPDPSPDRLHAIAESCNAEAALSDSLADFAVQLDNLITSNHNHPVIKDYQ